MKMENQAWKGFHGGEWQRSIDVRSFIQKNWTPYEGDGSFLTGPTRRTRAVWERCEDLLRQELRKGVLDVETHIVSGIDSFAPGYIDRENEVIVEDEQGSQWDLSVEDSNQLRAMIVGLG